MRLLGRFNSATYVQIYMCWCFEEKYLLHALGPPLLISCLKTSVLRTDLAKLLNRILKRLQIGFRVYYKITVFSAPDLAISPRDWVSDRQWTYVIMNNNLIDLSRTQRAVQRPFINSPAKWYSNQRQLILALVDYSILHQTIWISSRDGLSFHAIQFPDRRSPVSVKMSSRVDHKPMPRSLHLVGGACEGMLCHTGLVTACAALGKMFPSYYFLQSNSRNFTFNSFWKIN